ncbi:helix-turn-helix domain-containing protein [Streptomyces sp. NPDC101115]|uniref:helix-turn-helix domain-containing protein n=1 Tax=Streptomyces sp. NPDC101115 TaxID=3366106 RepID=UPI003823CC93
MPTHRTPPPDWVLDERAQLGKRIGERRQAQCLSQDQLADAIGMERRSIQRYEAGTRDPTYSVLLQIAKALEVDLADLVKKSPAGG